MPKSNYVDKHFFIALIALTIAVAMPEAIAAEGIMDTIVHSAESGASGWMDKALGYARNLFFGLAAIEFAWSAAQLVLQKSELSEIAVGVLMKVITISFFGMLLTFAPEWIKVIQESFKQAAGGMSGAADLASLTPSSLFDKGLDVSTRMLDAIPNSFNPATAFLYAVISGISAIIIILGYLIVAVQLAVTLIEMYIVLSAGALMLGFLGSRWTMNFGERYFGYAIATGAKLLTIYLVAAFGDTVTNAVIANIAAAGKDLAPADILGLAGSSLMFGAAGFMVPGMAGSMLNGSPSLSMSNALQAGKGLASAPVSAGLAGGAAAMRGLGMATGGIGMAAGLISKFGGGGKGGGISGALGAGGGGGGGIAGALGGGKPGGGGLGAALGGGKPAASAGGAASAARPGAQANAGGANAAAAKSAAPGGAGGGGEQGKSASPAGAAGAQGAAGGQAGSNAPGFQSPRTMSTSADADAGGQDDKKGKGGAAGKMQRFSEAMKRSSQSMQHAADRSKNSMGHDGHTGGAPNIRMEI